MKLLETPGEYCQKPETINTVKYEDMSWTVNTISSWRTCYLKAALFPFSLMFQKALYS